MTHGNVDQALEYLLAGAVQDPARDEVDGGLMPTWPEAKHAVFQQALRQFGRQWESVGAACGVDATSAQAYFHSVKVRIKRADSVHSDIATPEIEVYSKTVGGWIKATVVEDHHDKVLCRYRISATHVRHKWVRKGADIRQPGGEHASSEEEEDASDTEKIVAVLARQHAAGDEHRKERKEVMLIHTKRVICDAQSRTLELEFNPITCTPHMYELPRASEYDT
jgi:hypothetical protein